MFLTSIKQLSRAVIFSCLSAFAFTPSINTPVSQHPKSVRESLRDHGIEVSQPSLIAALKEGDPKVRVLAALELAEIGDSDAIQFIEQALSIEKNSSARIGIASALVSLHDPKGVENL